MASPIIIPFDNNPVAVSVKTASYTIPAGKFARVYVECDSGGIFTINAVNAVVTNAILNIDVGNASNVAVSYTAPSGYMAEVAFGASLSGDSYQVNGNGSTSLAGLDRSRQYKIGPAGTAVFGSGVAGNNKGITGAAIPSNATNRQAEFYLPAGTVISGSGNWKAVVQEYNKIS